MSYLMKKTAEPKGERISIDEKWDLDTALLKDNIDYYMDPYNIDNNDYAIKDVFEGAEAAGIDIGKLGKCEYIVLMENVENILDKSYNTLEIIKMIKEGEIDIDPDDKYVMVVYEPSRKYVSSSDIYDKLPEIKSKFFDFLVKKAKSGEIDDMNKYDITSYIVDASLVQKED